MKVQLKKLDSEEKIKAPDRDLESNELEAEEKAIRLPKGKFARIAPIPGTLGYYLRDIQGGNAAVIEFLKISLKDNPGTKGIKVKKMIKLWELFDEFSKNRIDVFDWFCRKFDFPIHKFYGVVAEGMCLHHDILTARALMESKTELVNNVRKFARKETNFRDRELLAKATRLTQEAPLIGSVNATTNVTNNNLTLEQSGFKSLINRTDRMIDEEGIVIDAEIVEENVEIKPRQLTEGNTNFISAKESLFDERELLLELER